MALTSAQLATLRADILADPVLSAMPNTQEAAWNIAVIYNTNASPNFTVWKTNVPIETVGRAFNGAEWAGMSSLNHTRLQTVAQYNSYVNPSLQDIRAMFDDIWSGAGGANTRTNLLALWKRLATRVEKLFATGTGSDASPGTMTFEGQISYQDVYNARAN